MKQREWQSSWTIGHNQHDNVRDWNAGIDAVTVVGQDHHAALPFYEEYDNIRARLGTIKEREKPFYLHGYRGKQCGSVRVGLKDDKCLLMVTGPQAEHVFKVARKYLVKYTRIDLQVTLGMDTPCRGWASDQYHSPDLTGARDRGKIYMSLVQSPTGDTMYFNKRTSPTYGRMYDKSQDYMGVLGQFWRFEVEAKEELCDKLGRILEYLDEYETVAADYVVGWYGDRGICVPLGPRDRVSIPEIPSGATGFQQTLDWLARQVGPSVHTLIQAGLGEEVERALGIQLEFPEYWKEKGSDK